VGWELLSHPPYSPAPDFAPLDFYLFGPMKEALRQVQQQRNKEKEVKKRSKEEVKKKYKTGLEINVKKSSLRG